mgnify:FL=1
MAIGHVTPILRIFDEVKAREFYLEFLGFTPNFEHRFEENSPLYMGIQRDDCALHLSEHHGDATPGSHIRIDTTDLRTFQQELATKNYKYNRPGIEKGPAGDEMTVIDPFSNRLTFTDKRGS